MTLIGQARVLFSAILCIASGVAGAQSITLASTTSTEQSGLFAHLLPLFKQASGLDVKVVAVGTGQALDIARRGDADALLVHDQAAEEKFVADGFGLQALCGHVQRLRADRAEDRSGRGTRFGYRRRTRGRSAPAMPHSFRAATRAVRTAPRTGTGPPPELASQRGSGYKECGCGMGPALNIAAASGAYVLADRGTWLAFKNRGDLTVLVEGDKRLFNQYGVIVVNPARHPHVKVAQAQQFADWIISPAGQSAIAAYKIGGEQLFFPNAGE